ncbi:family 10 glycosylhydrolase [Verrucomicrobiales bacterium]|nr:family 10 glycosylhydrolase [Verrucomicrobiales bacterium]
MKNFFLLVFAIFSPFAFGQYKPSNSQPPEPMREFRGAWVATVHNINWPSRPGLSGSQQRSELIALFDSAARVGLNAIILQVRTEGDALYKSPLEPWSYWLTGQMGKAPSDNYDPLTFACEEAHKRGLELHAWFNPFRARATKSHGVSSSHMSSKHPEWMMPNGSQTWANPGIRAVQDRAIEVMVDVARRYDVDAIHIDDYFYPYWKKVNGKMVRTFDDSATFEAYRRAGGKIRNADDWRLNEMNTFIERLYRSIKQTNAEVQFGISPFGIWRPGHPRSIEAGLDSVKHISADSKYWFENGWCDYFSPQLYWRIDDKPHSFLTLTQWWAKQNKAGRHFWPGIASDRIAAESARTARESIAQIEIARQFGANKVGMGHIHWSFAAIKKDSEGLRAQLGQIYGPTAISPASPWLATRAQTQLPGPQVQANVLQSGGVELNFKPTPGARWRLIQIREEPSGDWQTLRRKPGSTTKTTLRSAPAEIAVRNIDRIGVLSPAMVLAR